MTTHIEDHPYDKLLSEKGGTGFPTLMFLDAKGRKLAVHRGPRTPGGFEKSLEGEVSEFKELIDDVEGGNTRKAGELFLRQLALEWFTFEEAQKRYEELGKVSSKEKKAIEALLVDTEIRTHAKAAGRDEEKRRAAGAHFAEMWDAKRLPTGEARQYEFWSMIADHAEAKGDKKLFKNALKQFKKSSAGKNPRYRRVLERLEERLDNL